MLRHDDTVHREDDGAVRFDDLAEKFKAKFDGTSQWYIGAWITFLATRGATEEEVSILFEPWFFPTFPLFPSNPTDIQEVLSLIQHCKTMYCCRMTSPSTSTTSGTLTTCTPSSRADWFQEERVSKGTGRQCSSQPTGCTPIKIWKKFSTIWINPESQCTKILGELTQNTVYWCNSKLREKDSSSIKHDRTHSLFSTHYLRFVLRKWYAWRLEKNYTAKSTNLHGFRESYSRQICNMDVRIFLTPNREPSKRTKREKEETGRSHLEDTRPKHPEESQRGKYRESCRGNVDYSSRITRDSLIQDLNKTEEFDPFSEKSKELITSMGNTEYFEPLRDLFYDIMLWLRFVLGSGALWTAHAENACSVQKGIDSWTRQGTTVLSIPGCIIKKYPAHGARHGPSTRQVHVLRSTWYAEEWPQAQKWWLQDNSGNMAQWRQIPQVLVRCWVDWWTDHSIWCNRIARSFLRGYMARKKSERKILEHFFECRRYSRTTESAQWLYRCEAKMQQTVWRTYSNHWRWKHTYPSCTTSQATAWSTIAGLEEYDYRLEPRTRWRFYPSSRTTHSSSSSHWQQSSDWKSNRSWDSWQTSSWTEQRCFFSFFFVQRCRFACRNFNLLAIDGRCRQTHPPRTTFSLVPGSERAMKKFTKGETENNWLLLFL